MAVALVVLVFVGVVPPAEAHLGHVVRRAERYIKLEASSGTLRLVVSLSLGAQETPNVLGAADLNGDGLLSQVECDAYLEQWLDGLREELQVQLDGQTVQLTWGDAYLDPIGGIRAVPSAVEAVGSLSVTPGEHTVRVFDGMRVEAFDRSDVAFRYRDGAALLTSGVGTDPIERRRDLAFVGSAGHEGMSPLTATFRWPQPPTVSTSPDERGGWWWKLALFLAVATLVFGVRRWRKRAAQAP